MIPEFKYFLATFVDQGPVPKSFVEAIIKTKRFYRNDKSQILFLTGTYDFVLVERKQDLRSILEDSGVIKITGDPIGPSGEFGFWVALTSQKWKLPNVASYRAVSE
jgi:hypothetical protein